MIPLDELLAYRRGELASADEARVEEHLFSCDACARTLADVERLGAGIAALARGGGVAASATAGVLARLARDGARVRTYRLAPGEEVACTAAPDDDYVALRLAAPQAPARIDVAREGEVVATGAREAWLAEDVLVDREAGEVVLLFPAAPIHALPASRWRIDLRAGPGDAPLLGAYRLAHTPWEELPPERRR